MDNAKKENIKTALIVILGVIVFFGFTYVLSENTGDRTKDKVNTSTQAQTSSNPLLSEGEELPEDESKELVTLSVADLKNSIDKKEKKFVMLGTQSCSWCMYQKPILMYISYKYNLDLHYVDVGSLSEDDYNTLTSLHEDLASGFGTPTFLIVEDGKVASTMSGALGTADMTDVLKQNKFIEE